MIDLNRIAKTKQIAKSSNPVDIYNSSDRFSTTGPLRDTQKTILLDWYKNHFDQHDTIIKMHTGEGKTLVGLLILQSRLNEKRSPCVYICSNDYLVEQVCDDARKFGISVCRIGEDRELPDEFLSGKKILVINAYKMFNGLSKFGVMNENYEKINTIIVDDSHTCIDVIKSASTIILKNDIDSGIIYRSLITLFEEDLIEQREGSYAAMSDGDQSIIMVVPYWKWCDKKEDVIKILNKSRNEDCIKFAWPLIKDSISDCICCVTSAKIEISPYNPTVSQFPSFARADHRILMSATTQDDSYSIKCLDFDVSSVQNPLFDATKKWCGEKMILIPSLISKEYDEDYVRSYIFRLKKSNYGMLVIIPTNKKVSFYDSECTVATSKNIFEKISELKTSKSGILVVVNRYDGIDLPDDSCRIVLIDSMPYSDTLFDRYEEECRSDSVIINKKIAQKIEQGLGRGVRGEKDYCVIILVGPRLVKFVKSSNTKKFFSAQTRKQIDIGLGLIEEIKNEEVLNFGEITDLIHSCLIRDDNIQNELWKQYYNDEMSSIEDSDLSSNLYELFNDEREIEKLHTTSDRAAISNLVNFIDNHCKSSYEKGWYNQQLARYYYMLGDKTRSMKIQQSAFKNNQNLLRPPSIEYKKMGEFHEKRNIEIIKYMTSFESSEELKLHVDAILSNLVFGVDSEDFEKSIHEIGILLGFTSQRPEKESGRGPDNLWRVSMKNYFVFECKNKIKMDREFIFKSDAEQIDHSCIWFKEEYPNENAEFYLIHPALELDSHAVLDKDIRIIRAEKLRSFNNNLRNMFNELLNYDLTQLTSDLIQEMLNTHKLNSDTFKKEYSEEFKSSNYS